MAQAAKVVSIADAKKSVKNILLDRINTKALAGNGNRKMKHIASDLLNKMGGTDTKLGEKCELCPSTIKRMRECDDDYKPRADTIEKIIKASGAYVEVKSR